MSDVDQLVIGDAAALQPDADVIVVRGARTHNLRNLDLKIPRNQLVVFTGPSGCGKSSFLYSVIHAEGKRQFLELLSPAARTYLRQFARPDVDAITGLPPTIAVGQLRGGRNPRATVGSLTEVIDFLRVLYARVGVPYCVNCGVGARPETPGEILDRLFALGEGAKVMLLAPWPGADVEQSLREICKAGLLRVRVNGVIQEAHDVWDELDKRVAQNAEPSVPSHSIEAVVDRLVIREASRTRIAESLALALRHGRGGVRMMWQSPGSEANGSWEEFVCSTRNGCAICGADFAPLEPRNFNFNSPHGACPACDGLGRDERFSPQSLVADIHVPLASGGIPLLHDAPDAIKKKAKGLIERAVSDHPTGKQACWNDLSEPQRRALFYGDGATGLLDLFEKEFATTTDEDRLTELAAFRTETLCADCSGARLNRGARTVRVGGLAIHELAALELSQIRDALQALPLGSSEKTIAAPLIHEVDRRLGFLIDVGLHYLTLSRTVDSLSGGEYQRVRLASTLASGLMDACYILDEPTVGLHPLDGERLIDSLRALRDHGATVLVVDHDEAVIRAADTIVDMGPGAGRLGGRIVAKGDVQAVCDCGESLTGAYLSGRLSIAGRSEPTGAGAPPSGMVVLTGCSGRNLQNVDVNFPLGQFVAVVGPSGSGKSTLVLETLAPLLRRSLTGGGEEPAPFVSVSGLESIKHIVMVDQRPLGRSHRGNAATYTGVFDQIRNLFSATREAKALGYAASRFSFNSSGGRCDACRGLGALRADRTFFRDMEATCPACLGKRFNEATLRVRFKGFNIAEILDLEIDEAAQVFQAFQSVAEVLHRLSQVGLGYLKLGQPIEQLSGGEAQRLKLASELGHGTSQNTLYLLDEPTTGLHFHDVQRLLSVLQGLVAQGGTVMVIEHHVDLIRNADWIIELGPGGGKEGGRLLFAGPAAGIEQCEASVTRRWLVG